MATTSPTSPEATPPNGLGLSALADLAAKGDTAATAKQLKALAPGMIRAAHALMGSSHPEVDEVVQRSLIGLVQALPAFRGECTPAHYASRIVARISVAIRQQQRVRDDRRDDAAKVEAVVDCSRLSAHEAVA